MGGPIKKTVPVGRRDILVGKWEDRGSTLTPPFFCRYFFSWTDFGKGQAAGYFGGYMGGGSCHDAAFHATFRCGRLVEFVFSGRDWVSGDERPKPWPADAEACAEEHFQVFCQWIDFPRLEETGCLLMAPDRVAAAQESEWAGWELGPNYLFMAPSGSKGEAAMRKVATLAKFAGIATSWHFDTDE